MAIARGKNLASKHHFDPPSFKWPKKVDSSQVPDALKVNFIGCTLPSVGMGNRMWYVRTYVCMKVVENFQSPQ
jgi:hypothetical protein